MTARLAACLLVLLIGVAAGAQESAVDTEPVALEPESDLALDPAPSEPTALEPPADPGQPSVEAVASVLVERVSEDGTRTPLADLSVRLRGLSGGSPLASTTDADGLARFSLPADGSRWVAEVEADGLTFLASEALVPGQRDQVSLTVYPRRADASDLRIDRLVTLVRLHEGYLVFETYWFLSVHGDYVFAADTPEEGLEIRLPEGVEGIHVVQPTAEGAVEQGDIGVTLFGPFGPTGVMPSEGPSLLVTYSLPRDSVAHLFEQPMPLPVDEAIVLVPMETTYERYPRLDVELEVPVCGSGVDPREVVCFDDLEPSPTALALLPEQDRHEVHGGHGEAGAVLTFSTVGWPVPRDVFHLAAWLGIGLLAVGCFWMLRRLGTTPVATSARVPRAHLEGERRRLLRELAGARSEHDLGVLPVSEFEATELVLRARLEVVYEQLGVAPDPIDATGGSELLTREPADEARSRT